MRSLGLYHRVGNIPDHRSLTVGFRLTPHEDSFFALFTTLGDDLVHGAHELTNLVGAERCEREAVASRIRDIEHAADQGFHAFSGFGFWLLQGQWDRSAQEFEGPALGGGRYGEQVEAGLVVAGDA